jgi:CRP-like cAMP-binding protein
MDRRKIVECETCMNKNCFIKRHCSLVWISKISASKRNIHRKRGKYIIWEGNPVMGIYFIYRGKVKITITGENDKEQIVRLATDGHVLGHRGYGGESYPISAVAIDDSWICFVNNDTIYDAFMANPKFTYHLMKFYSQELRKSEKRIKYHAQMTVKEKVVAALLYIKDTFGLFPEEKALNVILKRKEIAAIAGTSSEQVSREINALKKEKILDKKGKIIILKDIEKLREIVKDYDPLNFE